MADARDGQQYQPSDARVPADRSTTGLGHDHSVPEGHLPVFSTLLNIDQRAEGRRHVVAVSGEVDLAGAPRLRAALDAALDARPRELRIDLGGTTFMDSSGLHVLFAVHAEAMALDCRLVIVCPRGPVLRLLEVTGYDARLPVVVARR
jgi:anti-sigma B factor antagonist